MNARAMREGVSAHHSFVGWHWHPEHVPNQLTGPVKLSRINAGVHAEVIAARAQSHHHLLQRGVAGPLTDSVDGTFHLAGAVHYAAQSVGGRQAEVVVTMHADGGARNVRNVLT